MSEKEQKEGIADIDRPPHPMEGLTSPMQSPGNTAHDVISSQTPDFLAPMIAEASGLAAATARQQLAALYPQLANEPRQQIDKLRRALLFNSSTLLPIEACLLSGKVEPNDGPCVLPVSWCASVFTAKVVAV